MYWNPIKLVLALVCGGIFLYAGVVKVMNPQLFLNDVQSFRLLPYTLDWLVSMLLPPFEIVIGGAVLFKGFRKEAFYIVATLMVVFLIVISISWARGIDISCGCFGGSSTNKTDYVSLILRDIAILLACFGTLFLPSNPVKPTHP